MPLPSYPLSIFPFLSLLVVARLSGSSTTVWLRWDIMHDLACLRREGGRTWWYAKQATGYASIPKRSQPAAGGTLHVAMFPCPHVAAWIGAVLGAREAAEELSQSCMWSMPSAWGTDTRLAHTTTHTHTYAHGHIRTHQWLLSRAATAKVELQMSPSREPEWQLSLLMLTLFHKWKLRRFIIVCLLILCLAAE